MNRSKELKLGRQIMIPGMAYAPTAETGVVFLFGRLAPQLGFCIESVRPQFPDCVATRKGRHYRIEFELWASDYEAHGHSPHGSDLIVCWENDWESRPQKYRHLDIISLKSHVGALPRVLVVGCNESISGDELRFSRVEWNVPTNAQIDDLVLIYRTAPTSAICDIWKIVGPFHRFGKRNREGRWPGLQAGLRRLITLDRPLTYSNLTNDPRTRVLSIVRNRFQGKMDVTEDWPLIYDRIVTLNPRAKTVLRPYHPT